MSLTSLTRISILYPNKAGARFDFDHYTKVHMPMAVDLLSTHPEYRGVTVERAVSGMEANTPPAFTAMCHFLFTSAEAFLEAFVPNAAALQGDMPNYTDIEPIIQFGQVAFSNVASKSA